MYPKWIFYFSRYFDLLGFCTGVSAKSLQHPKSVHFIFMFHIVQITILTVQAIEFLTRAGSSGNNKLGTINDDLKNITTLLIYWSSIFELYLKRDTQKEFWRRFNEIDEHYCSHRRFFLRDFVFHTLFRILIIAAVLTEYSVRVVFTKYFNVIFVEFWIVFIVLTMFSLNRLFYYLFYIELILYELKMIEREVNEVVRVNRMKLKSRLEVHKVKKFHRMRFEWIRQYYQLMWEMTLYVNEVFAWSNLPTILLPFQYILGDANWTIWRFHNSSPLRSGGVSLYTYRHKLEHQLEMFQFFI